MLHLIHPALVHFSVAFLVAGGIAELWGMASRRAPVERFGAVLVALGTISLVPTVVSGYLAANSIELPEGARGALDAHERNGIILVGVFVVALFWKGWNRGELPPRARPFYVALLLAAVLLTAYSALLGGELVYVHGLGRLDR